MPTVEERFKALLSEHLGIDDPNAMSSSLSELGINSMDAVSFLKIICKEFSIDFKPDGVPIFTTLQQASDHISSKI